MNNRIKASLLVQLVVVATLPAYAADNTDLPSLTHSIEVAAENIQLSDADWDQILTSAYALLPEQRQGWPVIKLQVYDQRHGSQQVLVNFEPDIISPNRTERDIVYCSREVDKSEWKCLSVYQAVEQYLPGFTEPIELMGPINESLAQDIAAELRAFVAQDPEKSKLPFQIKSMGGLSDADGQLTTVQVIAKLGDHQMSLHLDPQEELNGQWVVTGLQCFVDDAYNSQCDVNELADLVVLSQAAQLNQQQEQLPEDELEALFEIIRPLVSEPGLLADFQSPYVQSSDSGAVFVVIRFNPYNQFNNRALQATANCHKSLETLSWSCSVSESIDLQVPGQDQRMNIPSDMDNDVAMRVVNYVQDMLPQYSELELDPDQLTVLRIIEHPGMQVDGACVEGRVSVDVYAGEAGVVTVHFQRGAFEMGEMVVGEVLVRGGDRREGFDVLAVGRE